jgi:hypothetical protein
MRKPVKYRWINHGTARLESVGILEDGSLHNPNGYPEETVRTAVAEAEERQRERRSRGAQQAATTRARRQEQKVYAAAKRITEGLQTGPRENCCICGRGLDDADSVARGIGSDCWQLVLTELERYGDRVGRP